MKLVDINNYMKPPRNKELALRPYHFVSKNRCIANDSIYFSCMDFTSPSPLIDGLDFPIGIDKGLVLANLFKTTKDVIIERDLIKVIAEDKTIEVPFIKEIDYSTNRAYLLLDSVNEDDYLPVKLISGNEVIESNILDYLNDFKSKRSEDDRMLSDLINLTLDRDSDNVIFNLEQDKYRLDVEKQFITFQNKFKRVKSLKADLPTIFFKAYFDKSKLIMKYGNQKMTFYVMYLFLS
jgi:hypothetical protein